MNAIVSLRYVMEDGSSAEIAVSGNEGLVGISRCMGGETTPSRGVVERAGHGYRLCAYQAEGGIRGGAVTGVQTCALPISARPDVVVLDAAIRPRVGFALARALRARRIAVVILSSDADMPAVADACEAGLPVYLHEQAERSEERRVGKEGRSRWWPYH